MVAVTDPLDQLPESPESLIVKSFHAVLAADSLIASMGFNPVRLVELPDPDNVPEIASKSIIVAPPIVHLVDWPSKRQTIRVDVMVSAFLDWQPSSENSKLFGMRFRNHIRKLVWSNAELLNTVANAFVALGQPISIAMPFVRPLPLVPLKDKRLWGVRTLVTWENDIDPSIGEFE